MDNELDYSGAKIYYRTEGNGQPVVLLHGFGETGEAWNGQIDYLKDKFFLITPDLPGSGRSELIKDMSIEGMAELIKKIIDAELHATNLPTGTTVFMIGHSMGGYITMAFADKYEEMLAGFGLFHSSASADSEDKKATRRKGISFINEHGAHPFLKTMIPNLFAPQSKTRFSDLIDHLVGQAHNFSPKALVSYYESMINRPDRTNVLKTTVKPVLFVMGKYDTAIPMEDVLKQCSLPEKSYIHILHESGHMGMLEEQEMSNRLLEEFLSTN